MNNNISTSEKWLNNKSKSLTKKLNDKCEYKSVTKIFLEQKYNNKDNNKLYPKEIDSNIKMLELQIKNLNLQIKLLKENKISRDQLGQI